MTLEEIDAKQSGDLNKKVIKSAAESKLDWNDHENVTFACRVTAVTVDGLATVVCEQRTTETMVALRPVSDTATNN